MEYAAALDAQVNCVVLNGGHFFAWCACMMTILPPYKPKKKYFTFVTMCALAMWY